MDTALGIGTTVTASIPVGVIRQRPETFPLSVVIAGVPSRIRDSLASHVYHLGCASQIESGMPSGSGAGKALLLEDSLAIGLPAAGACSLHSLIDVGWKVAIYQTYPRRFRKEQFSHTPGIQFLPLPPSLRTLREVCLQASGSVANAPAAPVVPLDRPASVLVAEDNAENRLVIELLLNQLGCRPRIVNDGEEAWAALQAARFDFAILDLRMPGIDGLTLARRIRRELPAPPKLIALTASAFESDRDLCLDAGFDTFLSKPLRESDLRSVLSGGQAVPAPQGDPDSAWSIKNLTSFRSLCGDKAEVMIHTVLSDAGSWLDSPIVDQRPESIAEHAHKLAGSAMLIGAHKLAGALKRIEKLALTHVSHLPDAILTAKRAAEQAAGELELYP